MLLSIPYLSKFRFSKWAIILLGLYFVLFIVSLRTYIQWQSVNFILGIFSLPLVIQFYREKTSTRYGWIALVVAIVAVLLPVYTILYFALLLSMLFVIESFYARTNTLFFIILFFLSPIFQYSINVFSFPIRLQLSAWAGSLMSMIGMHVSVEGNMITHKANEFTVDAACMGLNMLVTSLIMAVAMLAWHIKVRNSNVGLLKVVLVLLFVTGFNFIANLLRIICMVTFVVHPGTVMHEVVGIFFFIVYVIIPTWYLSKYVVKKYGNGLIKTNAGKQGLPRHRNFFNCILLIVVSYAAFNINRKEEILIAEHPVTAYKVTSLPYDVVKLETESSLIYIKKIGSFYNADHTPFICWRGSGYEFSHINKSEYSRHKVFTGILLNKKDTLHTAWWYESAVDITTDQLKWRWNMLVDDQHYSVLNVTTDSKEQLDREVNAILKDRPFRHYLK